MRRHPIQFQNVSITTADKFGSGTPTTTVTDIVRTGGKVRHLSDRERVNSDLQLSTDSIRVECYYSPTLSQVSTDTQLVYQSNTYEIAQVDTFDQANNIIVFMARRLK